MSSDSTIERYFYHSFPRRRKGDDNSAKGLLILESICKNGLLLVPEVVTWTDVSTGKKGDTITAEQMRACFTELPRCELPTHANVFGSFALEFQIAQFKRMGGLPVIYIPNSSAEPKSMEITGIDLLCRIADASQIFSYISDAQRSQKPEMNITIEHQDGSKTGRQFNQIETKAIKEYLSLLEVATKQKHWNIGGAFSFLSSIFYPTENLEYTDQLGYYRQREWRICSGHFKNGVQIEILTTANQQQELINIDQEFFNRQLKTRDKTESIANRCRYINDFNGKRFLDLANRLIVPEQSKKKAEEILRDHKYDLIIDCI